MPSMRNVLTSLPAYSPVKSMVAVDGLDAGALAGDAAPASAIAIPASGALSSLSPPLIDDGGRSFSPVESSSSSSSNCICGVAPGIDTGAPEDSGARGRRASGPRPSGVSLGSCALHATAPSATRRRVCGIRPSTPLLHHSREHLATPAGAKQPGAQ